MALQEKIKVSTIKFTNFKPISTNQYADNMELAVTDFNKWVSYVPQYE